MAIYRNKKMVRDKNTGKYVVVTDAKGNPVYCDYWLIRFIDHRGVRKQVKLPATTRAEAQKLAAQLEARERAIKAGTIAKPTSAEAAAKRLYAEIVEEYIAWGELHGGRKNKPWSKANTRKRRFYCTWWEKALGLKVMGDLYGTLGCTEKALSELAKQGKTGKTLAAYREGLIAFCRWAKKRNYLSENPFESLGKFDTTPSRIRRDMSQDELNKLLQSVPDHRRILYETAMSTGFRAGELRSLSIDSLDLDRNLLRLSADIDKARKARQQPLAPALAKRLLEYAKTEDPRKRYKAAFWRARRPIAEGIPDSPLLYVPAHTERTFKSDLMKAGIPVETPAGILDFHALRVVYVNLVVRAGADVKTTQELARHSTADMTMKYYARPNEARMIDIAATVGDTVQAASGQICHDSATSEDDFAAKYDPGGMYKNTLKSSIPPAGTSFNMKPFGEYVEGLSHCYC